MHAERESITMMNKPKPVYLLAGGRWSSRKTPDPLIQAVFKENGVASPLVAYVGTASADDRVFFQRVASVLREAGAGKVIHASISAYNADLKEAQEILNSADIVFISGGDVEKGMCILEEKNMVDFLRKLYERGKLFFGLSAGSIMLAKKWVRWSDPNDDSTAELFPCLGFVPIICDTHGEQDDWGELQAALRLAEDEKAYGIVSGTAVKVYPDGEMEALGGPVHQFVRREDRVIRVSDILPVA